MARLTDEQRAEVERWLPLAEGMAHTRLRRYLGRFDPGDVQAWAAFGLIDAVQKFDPAWSPPAQRDLFFSVYARTRISGAIVDGFRRESTVQRFRRGSDYFYDNPLIDRQDPALMADFDSGHDGGLTAVDDRLEARAVLDAVIDELDVPADPRHPRKVEPAEVVRLLVRGMSARRIAERCGVDESRVSQIVKRQVRPLLVAHLRGES